jgi:hypothetical protein
MTEKHKHSSSSFVKYQLGPAHLLNPIHSHPSPSMPPGTPPKRVLPQPHSMHRLGGINLAVAYDFTHAFAKGPIEK